jgi:hypothetical protein
VSPAIGWNAAELTVDLDGHGYSAIARPERRNTR